jgi:AcrR family transcriptional regulator
MSFGGGGGFNGIGRQHLMARTKVVVPVAVLEKNRRKIIAAATTVFLKKGYKATLDDVCFAAAVTRRTLYNHFSDKQDLFFAVIETAYKDIASLPSTDINLDDSPIELALHKQAEVYSQIVLDPRAIDLTKIMAEPNSFHALSMRALEVSQARLFPQLERYFTTKMDNGDIIRLDPTLLTEQFLAVVQGTVRIRLILNVPPQAYDHDAYLAQSIRIFVRGITA